MDKIGQIGTSTFIAKRRKGVHPLVDKQFGYVRLAAPLLDIAGISTKFCGAIITQFGFTYSREGDCCAARATR